MGKSQPGGLLSLLPFFKLLGVLALVCNFFLESNVRLIEVLNRTFAHLFAVVCDAEFRGPVAHSLYCLLKIGNVIMVGLANILMHLYDTARFLVIVMILTKNGSCCVLKALIRSSKSFGGIKLLDHKSLHIQNV